MSNNQDDPFTKTRMRSKTFVVSEKQRDKKLQSSGQPSQSKEDKANAKDAVRQALVDIENNFKLLKHLPNQRLHPFDLSQDELCEIKQYFPEFFAKNLADKRQSTAKGIEIKELQRILQSKIDISKERMDGIIAKFDHKSKDKITWTEFLAFLQNEGFRRQQVNDAQLYGQGVKRLVEKDKFKLARGNE